MLVRGPVKRELALRDNPDQWREWRGRGHDPALADWSESSKAGLNATEFTGNIFTTGTKEEGPGNPADFLTRSAGMEEQLPSAAAVSTHML